MTEQTFSSIDKLSEEIRRLQKCLECTICLHIISAPVKTICGHWFCRTCIMPIVNKKNATCPLCKKGLKRRSVLNDGSMEVYIEKFEKLVEAIRLDSGIDILSHVKRTYDTKESTSASCRTHYNETAMSGVRRLPPDEVDESKQNPKVGSKVSSWLNSLPDTEKFESPGKNASTKRTDDATEDTAIDSISGIYSTSTDVDAEINEPNNHGETARKSKRLQKNDNQERQTCRSMKRRSLGNPSQNENNGGGANKGRKTRRSFETKNDSATTGLKFNAVHAKVRKKDMIEMQSKPGTSNALKSNNDNQPLEDIWRTPKKLSANNKIGNVSNNSESLGNARAMDTGCLQKNETLPILEDVRTTAQRLGKNNEEETPTKNNSNRSMSEAAQPESSFITLEEGERVPIRNLNNQQMSDIIGIIDEDDNPNLGANDLSPDNRKSKEITLPLKKRSSIPGTPRNQFYNPPKSGIVSSPDIKKVRKITDFFPSPKFQSPESSTHSRLSLRKKPGSSQRESTKSCTPSNISRLSSVKRDLTGQIDKSKQDTIHGNNNPVLLKNRKHVPQETSPKSLNSPKHDKQNSTAIVTFKKLGRIIKPRKKVAKFLYLGSTKRTRFRDALQTSTLVNLEKPCNPVDTPEKFDCPSSSVDPFGNNSQLTLDHTRRSINRDETPLKHNKHDNHPNESIIQSNNKPVQQAEDLVQTGEKITSIERILPINAKMPTKRIDVYKDNIANNSKHCSASTSNVNCKSQDSEDVLIISLPEYEDQSSEPSTSATLKKPDSTSAQLENSMAGKKNSISESSNCKTDVPRRRNLTPPRKTVSEKPPITSVNLTSPEKDSQLMLLMYASPSSEALHRKKMMESRKRSPASNVAVAEPKELTPKRCGSMVPNEDDSRKPTIRKDIILHSPVRYQLKQNKSPSLEDLADPEPLEFVVAVNDNSPRKSHFSEIKGTHSKALIRRSQQGSSGSSQISSASTPKKKRKRSSTREKLPHRIKRKSTGNTRDVQTISDGSDTDTSLSSKMTVQIDRRKTGSNKNTEPPKVDEPGISNLGSDEIHADNHSLTNNEVQKKTTVSFSSGSETMVEEDDDVPKVPGKKSFRKIKCLPSSDTDSDATCIRKPSKTDSNIISNDRDTSVSGKITKRKRLASMESDEEINVAAIVSSWCNDIQLPDRSAKKGKMERVSSQNNLTKSKTQDRKTDSFLKSGRADTTSGDVVRTSVSRDTSSMDKDLFDSNTMFIENNVNQFDTGKHETPRNSRSTPSDKDDFNSIIDRVREIQRTESNITSDNNGRLLSNKDQLNDKEDCLMHDMFDEIIANVDTQALLAGLPPSDKNIPDSQSTNKRSVPSEKPMDERPPSASIEKAKSAMPTMSTSFTNENVLAAHNLDGSDKENKARFQRDGRSHDTANEENKSGKSSVTNYPVNTAKNNRSPSQRKEFKADTAAKSLIRNASVPASPENDDCIAVHSITHENAAAAKDSSYEHDSLMDITQYQLMIKQFEEDLFSTAKQRAATKVEDTKPSDNDKRTPRKEKNSATSCRTPNTKDTNASTGEEDIVEGTPHKMTKISMGNLQSMSTSARKSLKMTPETSKLRTPINQMMEWRATEGTSNSAASTPLSKKNLYPLYQSTPKVQRIDTKSNHSNEATCAENKRVEHVPNTVLVSKSVNDQATGNTNKQPERRRLCFVCSGIASSQIERVKELAEMFNARYTTQFCDEVTHVIVRVDDDNSTNKTLKYLQGIAHRKWIVGYKWVVDSLQEKRLVNEEPYEPVDSTTLEAGPRKSRLRSKGIFEGFVFLCIGPYADVSIEQYKDLLVSTGARVVDTLEDLTAENKELKIIVIQCDIHDDNIIDWYQKARAVPVIHDWVVECISQYKLISLYPFLQGLAPEHVLALGYPHFLVEEEVEAESDNSDAST